MKKKLWEIFEKIFKISAKNNYHHSDFNLGEIFMGDINKIKDLMENKCYISAKGKMENLTKDFLEYKEDRTELIKILDDLKNV